MASCRLISPFGGEGVGGGCHLPEKRDLSSSDVLADKLLLLVDECRSIQSATGITAVGSGQSMTPAVSGTHDMSTVGRTLAFSSGSATLIQGLCRRSCAALVGRWHWIPWTDGPRHDCSDGSFVYILAGYG